MGKNKLDAQFSDPKEIIWILGRFDCSDFTSREFHLLGVVNEDF